MKLYIDVTQLVNWQGNITGIPRVMNELTTRLVGDSTGATEVELIKWHGEERRFVTANLGVKAIVSAVSVVPVNRTKKILRSIYSASPQFVQRLARAAYASYKKSNQSEPVALQQYSFVTGSKLLVAWGEWGDAAYRQKLVQISAEGVELYQIIYDMLPIVTPQFSSHSTEWLTEYVKQVYPICRGLISISEHTKKDVVEWLEQQKLKVPPISVVRLGEDFEIKDPKKPDNLFINKNLPYLLCVGTIEIRKNHQLLYYVYKRAQALGISLPPLVIVGRRGWMTEQTYELMTKDPAVKDSFVFMHSVSDEELSWLYEHSLFSIYPSFYEGWGLPVAESIVRNTPCLTSNTSSIPEVAGDLAGYFDPTSPDECLNEIQKLLDEGQLAIVREKLKTYKPTSWDETFLQVKKAIGV